MEIVKPYSNINDALSSLDNGGRFYNLFTKANDGLISEAELSKTGSILDDKQTLILLLEMSISKLKKSDKEVVISKLDEKLKKSYLKYKPKNLLPAEIKKKGVLSSNAILTCIPKLVDSKSSFNGFIMVPIMVNSVTTFSPIPIIESYDIYELKDEVSSETFIIAHSKDFKKLPNKKITVGGVLKEFDITEDEKGDDQMFLEVLYYI